VLSSPNPENGADSMVVNAEDLGLFLQKRYIDEVKPDQKAPEFG
jgi:hypothetical protein